MIFDFLTGAMLKGNEISTTHQINKYTIFLGENKCKKKLKLCVMDTRKL